jgi:PEGA domain-containing protein
VRSEGGALGLLVLVASGFVALCCAVIVLAGKPAPDEPDAIDEVAPVHEAQAAAAPAAPSEPAAATDTAAPTESPPEPPSAEPAAAPPPAPRAPAPPPAQPADPYADGHLHVYSTPAARIFIDGSDTGLRTPIRGDKLSLSPGKHKVTFVVGDDKFTFAVRIKAGETQSITKTLTPSPAPSP